MKQLTIEEINALIIATRITNNVIKELLNRYDKNSPNYNALADLSTNIQTARNKLKAK